MNITLKYLQSWTYFPVHCLQQYSCNHGNCNKFIQFTGEWLVAMATTQRLNSVVYFPPALVSLSCPERTFTDHSSIHLNVSIPSFIWEKEKPLLPICFWLLDEKAKFTYIKFQFLPLCKDNCVINTKQRQRMLKGENWIAYILLYRHGFIFMYHFYYLM